MIILKCLILSLIGLVLLISCGTEPTSIYTLNTSVNGEGQIGYSVGDSEEITISNGMEQFDEGESITLTALPDAGWVFSNWGGEDTSTQNPIRFTMDGDISYVGYFDSPFETLEIAKWWSDYSSAYTVTYDMGFPFLNDFENKWLIENGLYIDYEIVTATYNSIPSRVDYLKSLKAENFGYFGHGHEHIDHDKISYEEAYNSFKNNYDSIKSYGIQPISYAYPYGAGRRDSTRIALKESGFLSGRLNQEDFEGYGPFIMEYAESSPKDWFGLPALRMEDIEFQGCDYCINSPHELLPYIYENINRKSWLITTYHAIGFDGNTDDRPIGWGFYKRENFFQEMNTVKSLMENKKLWLASMNDVTLYTYLRNNTTFEIMYENNSTFKLVFKSTVDKNQINTDITLKMFINQNMGYNSMIIENSYNKIFESDTLSDTLIVNLNPHDGPYKISFE